MKTPTMAEALRDEAKLVERRRILLMAIESKSLEELIAKLKDKDEE